MGINIGREGAFMADVRGSRFSRRALIAGGALATAGGAVLRSCLEAAAVEEVRAITRRPLARPVGSTGVKLREIVHANYLDYTAVAEAFRAVDARGFAVTLTALLDGLTVQIALEDPVVDPAGAFELSMHFVADRLGFSWTPGRGRPAPGHLAEG